MTTSQLDSIMNHFRADGLEPRGSIQRWAFVQSLCDGDVLTRGDATNLIFMGPIENVCVQALVFLSLSSPTCRTRGSVVISFRSQTQRYFLHLLFPVLALRESLIVCLLRMCEIFKRENDVAWEKWILEFVCLGQPLSTVESDQIETVPFLYDRWVWQGCPYFFSFTFFFFITLDSHQYLFCYDKDIISMMVMMVGQDDN